MSQRAQLQPKPSGPLPVKPVSGLMLLRKCAWGGTPGPSSEFKECHKKRLQRKALDFHNLRPSTLNPQPSEAPAIVHEVLRSPGQPLDATTRAFFEPRFGHDFGAVRLHTDARAAASARAVNSLAYTVGDDVVLGSRQYAMQSSEGKRLLAHELTHVLQQRGRNTHCPKPSAVGSVISETQGDSLEQEAEKVSAGIIQEKVPTFMHVTHLGRSQLQLQSAPLKNNVTSIDVITGPQGALTGFPQLPDNCNLNAPGPINNTTTGTCRNIHQIHFRLAGIQSKDVSILRIVERKTVAAGKTETINKSDGPSPETVVRPNTSTIAVADCPGAVVSLPPGVQPQSVFPISYHAHFILGAFDTLGNVPLAKLVYDITIDKNAINDPTPTNKFTEIYKQIF